MCSLVDKLPLEPFVEMAERTDTVTRSRGKKTLIVLQQNILSLGWTPWTKCVVKKLIKGCLGPKITMAMVQGTLDGIVEKLFFGAYPRKRARRRDGKRRHNSGWTRCVRHIARLDTPTLSSVSNTPKYFCVSTHNWMNTMWPTTHCGAWLSNTPGSPKCVKQETI